MVDTREQDVYEFAGIVADARDGRRPVQVQTVRRGLATGDYSIEGMESVVAVERKSKSDLYSTLGQSRARFVRELERLAKIPYAFVVIEAEWRELLGGYSPRLQRLAAVFEILAVKGEDVSRPWAEWAAILRESMPGPPEHSKLNPKTVWRSVAAWMARYPNIKWLTLPGRAFAERATYRILERVHKERTAAAS